MNELFGIGARRVANYTASQRWNVPISNFSHSLTHQGNDIISFIEIFAQQVL